MAQAAGGVDRYIRMLLKYLDKEKFENILVCSQDFNREDYDGLVDSFEQIEMNRAIGVSDLNSIKEVRRLIKKYNPDIVYAHSSKAGAIARVADIGLKNHCVYNPHAIVFVLVCAVKVFCSLFGGSDISKLLDLPTFYFMFAVIILECKENRLKGNFYKHLRSTSETMYFIHMYFVAFCALVLYKDDYNNFKSYLICAGGALAVSEIYSWMKNISNRSTTVSRLKHD